MEDLGKEDISKQSNSSQQTSIPTNESEEECLSIYTINLKVNKFINETHQ